MVREFLLASLCALLVVGVIHSSGFDQTNLNELAERAVNADASKAIETLRKAGPKGLAAILEVHATKMPAEGKTEPMDWQRIRCAIDAVAGQRDAVASRLYWYTDFALAQEAAKREHKPILSLRLLGNLTDEYSCANSRFFRTMLYANSDVSQVLRDQFILHWQTVRPVPIVTIDFGDGRKLKRTVTGNSIHYVLAANGDPIDGLPGLYGPQAFLRSLERARAIANQYLTASELDRARLMDKFHRDRALELQKDWQRDLQAVGESLPGPIPQKPKTVDAAEASKIALPKSFAEAPIIAAAFNVSEAALTGATTDEVWQKIAALHSEDAKLDAASRALIERQHPTAGQAAPLAITKKKVEDPLTRLIRGFQASAALDTVRNEYLLHRQIHNWFASDQVTDVDSLNQRVYAELFLTPDSDRWLGLIPAGAYTALEENGVMEQAGL